MSAVAGAMFIIMHRRGRRILDFSCFDASQIGEVCVTTR